MRWGKSFCARHVCGSKLRLTSPSMTSWRHTARFGAFPAVSPPHPPNPHPRTISYPGMAVGYANPHNPQDTPSLHNTSPPPNPLGISPGVLW